MADLKLAIAHEFARYNSIDTDICGYDPSPLSPTSKMVFHQWKMDETDDLLIDGYYRECNISTYISDELSSDIKQIIISFYLKQYSKRHLKKKILQLKRLSEYNRQLRKEKCIRICCICLAIFVFFGFIFGSDIAGLIIANINDCNVTIDGGSKYVSFGVHQFLYIGSITHIAVVSLILLIIWYLYDRFLLTIFCLIFCVILFFISWAIIGALLYSEMD
eukprot:462821_1